MIPRVMVVSRDPGLLLTRQLILGAFFHVKSAGRLREAEGLIQNFRFDLIILCYTLSESECRRILELIEDCRFRPRVLLLTTAGRPGKRLADATVMVEAGPYYLLKKSAEMLGIDIKEKANLVEA